MILRHFLSPTITSRSHEFLIVKPLPGQRPRVFWEHCKFYFKSKDNAITPLLFFFNDPLSVTRLKLSAELLHKIFIFAHSEVVDDKQWQRSTGALADQRTEIHISHVCGSWRSIALFTPELWRNFYSACPARSNSCAPSTYSAANLERLECYLKRSRGYLLDIWLDFGKCNNGSNHASLVRFATRHARRWRSITLLALGDEYDVMHIWLPLVNLGVPQLEHSDIRLLARYGERESDDNGPIEEEGRFEDISIFRGGAPNLRYVSLDPSAPGRYTPALRNITSLYFQQARDSGRNTVIENFLCLFQLPSLMFLSIDGFLSCASNVAAFLSEHSVNLQLQKLKYLILNGSGGMLALLPYIHAPQQEVLVLEGLNIDFGDNVIQSPPPSSYDYRALKTLVLIDTLYWKSDPSGGTHIRLLFDITASVVHVVISQAVTRYPQDAGTLLLNLAMADAVNPQAWEYIKTINA